MPRSQAESPEDRAIREVADEDETALQKIAMAAGPPPDAEQLSEADEDQAWETVDPSVEYETMAKQLLAQGLPPEVAQNLLIVKLRPDWAPLYARPTQDAEQADMLTKLAQWPFRLSVIEDIDDPDEAVRKAEQLDRRYQKRMTVMQEQSATMAGQAGSYGGGAPTPPERTV